MHVHEDTGRYRSTSCFTLYSTNPQMPRRTRLYKPVNIDSNNAGFQILKKIHFRNVLWGRKSFQMTSCPCISWNQTHIQGIWIWLSVSLSSVYLYTVQRTYWLKMHTHTHTCSSKGSKTWISSYSSFEEFTWSRFLSSVCQVDRCFLSSNDISSQ